ncbi:MAG: transposase [Elusimicrobia bacterium]|nr:transposase [Elusimicrobiota bacterium]
MGRCRDLTPKHKFRFKNPLYSFDSTSIELALSAFPWARYAKRQGGIKLHCQFEHGGQIPVFMTVTDAKQHDITVAKEVFRFVPDSIYCFDRGFNDYGWFRRITDEKAFFVARAKSNAGKITNERTGLEFPGQHEPIIESDVFDEVQKLMDEHARHERHEYSVNKFDFTLKGLARCGKCGSALVGYVRPKKNKVYRYYRCMAMVDGAPISCDFMSITADQLEEMAVRQLEQIGWDEELLAGVVREAEKQARKNSIELEGERRELELNLVDVRNGLGNLRPLLEKCPDLRQLAEEVRRLDVVERELAGHVEKLDRRTAALRDTNYDVAAAQEALKSFGRMLAGLPIPRQVAILRSLIRRARVWKDRIELDLNEEAVAGLKGLLVEAAGMAQNA